MIQNYDLVVIGSGTAAQVASSRVRAAGWSVAVIDHLPFGGTCALRGCDSTKVLISGVDAVDMARRMRGRGITGEAAISWPDLIAFKRTFTDPVPANHERRYAERGIDVFHGTARFTAPSTIEVPSVAFTLPPIASVGLGEAQALATGLRFRVNRQKVSNWYTARRVAETVYGYKTLVEGDSGRILGAHLVGPHADVVINLFALAIRNGLPAEQIKQTIFAYPTGASDIGYMLHRLKGELYRDPGIGHHLPKLRGVENRDNAD